MRKTLTAILLALALLAPSAAFSAKSASTGHRSKSDASHKTKAAKTKVANGKRTHVLTSDSNAPKGSKARCGDGTYSTASGRGACSHHGGVDAWLVDQPQK